jgi:hypothetical protein
MSSSTNEPSQASASSPRDFFDHAAGAVRWLGTASLLATLFSRNLFPSEDATSGTGIYFLPLAFLAGICLLAERSLGVRGPRLLVPALAWLALVAGWALAASKAEYSYPAIQMVWEWLATGMVALYAWHQGGTAGSARVASAVVIIVLMQSFLAGYESLVTLPHLRTMYEKNDPAVAEAMRAIGVERGSKFEESFRNRLYSSEPLGTTGHPNSLAGILVLALPAVVLLVRESFRSRPGGSGRRGLERWLGRTVAMGVLTAVLAALLLTKSRSAWLAVPPMLLVWFWLRRREHRHLAISWQLLAAGLAILLVLGTGLTRAGILDREIISQAGQSLAYRWEWWQASWPIIVRSPLWGVGPGNFRNHYLEFKLPFSSEEIADPHQFAIELAATGGIVCLLAYGVLLLVTWRAATRPADRPTEPVSVGLPVEGWFGLLLGIALVALLETGLVPLVARPLEHPALGVALIAAGVVGLLGRVGVRWQDGSLRPALAAGVVGLHLHWLMSGGVAFPALMVASWGLLSSSAGGISPARKGSSMVDLVGGAALAGLTLLFVFSALAPRLERDPWVARARTMEEKISQAWSPSDPEVRPTLWVRLVREFQTWAEACRSAAQQLPADREGWERLAMAETSLMRLSARLRHPEEQAAYRRSLKAWDEILRLDPRRSASYAQRGALFREVAASGLDPEAGRRAERDLARAAELYPNLARRQWEWGEALQGIGENREAARRYQRAIELNQTPHTDKRLSEPQRQWAEAFLKNHPPEVSPSPAREGGGP